MTIEKTKALKIAAFGAPPLSSFPSFADTFKGETTF